MSYQAALEPLADEWTLVRVALTAFRPGLRGRSVLDAPALDPTRVRQIGLSIADRQEGAFALAVRSISVEPDVV